MEDMAFSSKESRRGWSAVLSQRTRGGTVAASVNDRDLSLSVPWRLSWHYRALRVSLLLCLMSSAERREM